MSTVPTKKRAQVGRPTLEELERRKNRVLEVATRLFTEEGYAATSLIDIAKEAGVATRTIYQHFGDKPAMFREVIFARNIAEATTKPELGASDSIHSALIKAGLYVYELTFRPRSIELMRLMIAERNRFPQIIKKVLNGTSSGLHSGVEHIFDELAKRGAIPRGDHQTTAKYFVDFILGGSAINVYAEWDSEIPTEDELREKVGIFILGRFGVDVANASTSPLPGSASGKGRATRTSHRYSDRAIIPRRRRASRA